MTSMGNNLADVISELTSESRDSTRIGSVVVVDTGQGLLDVQVSGTLVKGLPYLTSYIPKALDKVLVAVISGQWVVLGRLSGKGIRPPDIKTVTIPAAWVRRGAQFIGSTTWTVAPPAQGSGKIGTGSLLAYNWSGLWGYPDLSLYLKPDDVLEGARFTVARGSVGADQRQVSPQLYTHNYTSPPAGTDPAQFVLGPVKTGDLAPGESAVWTLPESWCNEIRKKTFKGFGIYSADRTAFMDTPNPTNSIAALTLLIRSNK